AEKIYDMAAEQIADANFTARGLLKRMNVEVVCTTDDPIDSLEHHRKVADEGESFKLLPAFRPDKAMNAGDAVALNSYIDQLEAVTDIAMNSFNAYLDGLKKRHDYFASYGCTVSDRGIEQLYVEPY